MVILSKKELILFNEKDTYKQTNPFNYEHPFTLYRLLEKENDQFFTILSNTVYFVTIN